MFVPGLCYRILDCPLPHSSLRDLDGSEQEMGHDGVTLRGSLPEMLA